MDQQQLMKIGVALGVCFAAYKYGKKEWIKAMALGVAGTVIAKQVPYVQDALM